MRISDWSSDWCSSDLFTAPPLHDGRPGVWGIGWHIGRSAAGRVPAPGGGAKAQVVLYPDGLAVILLTNLLGAFPEHLAPVSAHEIDLSFIDPIAELYTSWLAKTARGLCRA